MGDNGYKLDLLSPVRHVATEMDRAAGAALSIKELAAGYQHPIPGDLARVRLHEDCATDTDAVWWIISRAVEALTYQGKTARSKMQVAAEGDRFRLAVPFDELQYKGLKLRRAEGDAAKEERQALLALYADLTAERPFYVTVQGDRGGTKETRLRLHPLAHAIPPMAFERFREMATDVKRRGVRNPITVYDGQVLDGRHRIALAAAWKLPVRVVPFDGDETAARDEVVSQNLQRRHLTMAQRGLIVRELYLPQAEAEAKERVGGRPPKDGEKPTADLRQVSRGPTAAQIAAQEANGLASARTIELMAPVDDAPETKERVRAGKITSATKAREAALKELGSDEPTDVGKTKPLSAFHNLGGALGKVNDAIDAIERGDRGKSGVTADQLIERINEIRERLDRAEVLLQAVPVR